jgi:copper transport outer membrane protein MctB
MFDFRYHIASLAAVFLALVLGILIGVAISGRGFVDKSERRVLDNQIRELTRARDAERARADQLQRNQQVSEEFISSSYPVLMKDRLRGKRIAVLVIGPSGGETGAEVDDTLAAAGATQLRFRALKVPVDARTIREALGSRPPLRAFAGERQLNALGRELAIELVGGGKTPLWDALQTTIVEQQRGGLDRPADGIVLIRAVKPQQGQTVSFLAGLYEGLATAGVPAVGVELVNAEKSAVARWRIAHLSSVDDVDTMEGRLALALLLAGAAPGHYGIKETAQDVLPPIARVG